MKTASALMGVALISVCSVLLPGATRISVSTAHPTESQDSQAKEGSMEQQIVAKEKEELDCLKTGDLERFGNLTADDAVFVDPSGSASKAQVLKNVAGFTLTEYSMADVQFLRLSSNTGLIVYKLFERGVSHGKEFEAHVHASSIWTERGNRWVTLFSQETPAK